jgi:hypothetical protein
VKHERVPEGVRRFLLGAIASVPHLEALLLLRGAPGSEWSARTVAQHLFIAEERAKVILADLRQRALVAELPPGVFHYAPETDEDYATIDQLADYYSRHIVEVANLLHAQLERQALEFSEAFRLRKES